MSSPACGRRRRPAFPQVLGLSWALITQRSQVQILSPRRKSPGQSTDGLGFHRPQADFLRLSLVFRVLRHLVIWSRPERDELLEDVGGLGLHWRLSGSSRTILRVSTGRTCTTGAFHARETGCPQKGRQSPEQGCTRSAGVVRVACWREGVYDIVSSLRGIPRSSGGACSVSSERVSRWSAPIEPFSPASRDDGRAGEGHQAAIAGAIVPVALITGWWCLWMRETRG
jgi:hypothetical protein